MPNYMRRLVSVAWSLGAGVALLSLTTTTASAQATLTGCYVPNSGTVYRIKAPDLPGACHSKNHVEFTWSLQGPQGVQGPAGPTGPQGPAGPAGGLAVSAIKVVTAFTAPIPAGGKGSVAVDCPAGTIATGGGGRSTSPSVPLRLLGSIPFRANDTPIAWVLDFENPNAIAIEGHAFVVCVPAS